MELKQEMRGIKEGMAEIAEIKKMLMLMLITKKEEEKEEKEEKEEDLEDLFWEGKFLQLSTKERIKWLLRELS